MPNLPPELEDNVLIEFPVGAEFRRQRGYSRFVRFKLGVAWIEVDGVQTSAIGVAKRKGEGKLYGLIEEPLDPARAHASPMTNGSKLAPVCHSCGYRGATEHGRCAICGTSREAK